MNDAGRIAMLLSSRVEGRTVGLHGPDLDRGPEVARPCCRPTHEELEEFNPELDPAPSIWRESYSDSRREARK